MVFISEAFGGWLLGQLADAARKRLGTWLLGSEQERALREAATAAIEASAQQLRPGPATVDDPQGADHLAQIIDQVFQQAPTPAESLTEHATLLQGLQAEVAGRLAVLEDADITGTGQSAAQVLDVSVPTLAELLTGHLLREILVRGATGGPLTPLAAQLNHDLTHLQGHQHSASLTRLTQQVQAALARLDEGDQPARSIPARPTTPLGRPVHELTDPFALEVHRAIDAPGRAALPALPMYVERDDDRQLQAIVEQAADGRSSVAVLVGGSSTGKTRACWEAVQALPADWRLWHPIDPSRPEAAADALPAVGPRTVIWLNEAQHYLLTPASELGERVAAGLRELLRDPGRGPVLLLGTIWPEYWATLTTPPAPGQQDDPHAQARALLTGADIPVPDAFNRAALQALGAVAGADPRLVEAARQAEDGRITQFLAGGPALLERYRNAPAGAKALIEAAMDARRLGHGLNLPHPLLETAAPGYLTDQQWDELGEDWLAQALAYCAAPCRGARGPLTRTRPRPGQNAPAQPQYRLADYLEQTGRATRATDLTPATLWDGLVVHTADRANLAPIALAARSRFLYTYAERLYRRGVEVGDEMSRHHLYELLADQWRVDELRQLAVTGDLEAHRALVRALHASGSLGAAVHACQQAIAAGCTDMLMTLADLYEQQGKVEDLLTTLRQATTAGDGYARLRLVGLLVKNGRPDEALAAASADADPATRWSLVRELLDSPHRDQAITLVRSLVDEAALPDVIDSIWLLRQLRAYGREDVIDLLASAGYEPARRELALLRAERADLVELDRLIDAGDDAALQRRVQLLAERGDEAALRALMAQGNRAAQWELTELLTREGRSEEAIEVVRPLATSGSFFVRQEAAARLVGLLIENGDERELDRLSRSPDGVMLRPLADWWYQTGQLDRLRQYANSNDGYIRRRLARLLDNAGLETELEELATRSTAASRQVVERLVERGRVDELCERVVAGNGFARRVLLRLVESGDPSVDAASIRRFGLNPDGSVASPPSSSEQLDGRWSNSRTHNFAPDARK